MTSRLPQFPWDRLDAARSRAREYAGGVVDLSVGTPVDPVPAVAQTALIGAANSPGYPLTAGTPELRESVARWLTDRHGVTGLDPAAVLPTVGSKELVASLPAQLGLGPGDVVLIPELAYPTYDIGARLAGAEAVCCDDPATLPAELAARVRLVWINSPSNPTGAVLAAEQMRAVLDWSRAHGAVLASDECYLDLGWTAQPVSVLHPDVCSGDHTGILAVHSLSKRSNLAGYRAAFVAGDPALISELLHVRRHSGLMVAAPVQAAMAAAYGDEKHLAEQRSRYADRRALLRPALEAAGFTVQHSDAGLYLWARTAQSCWDSVDALAQKGILVAPGEIYGSAGARHIRVALTATDKRIRIAVERLMDAESASA